MNLSKDSINWISLAGTVATFISLWLAIYWNWQSNRKAKKREAETYRRFVILLNSIRQIELERLTMQRKKLERDCDLLKCRHGTFMLRTDATQDEKDEEAREYLLRSGQLAGDVSDLDIFITKLGSEVADDFNKFMEFLKKQYGI